MLCFALTGKLGREQNGRITNLCNPKMKIVLAVVTFFIAYFFVTLFQTERGRCNKLASLWDASSGSLVELSTASKQISDATSDDELKFVADYLSTLASSYDDGGVHDLSEVKRGSGIDMFAAGFVNQAVNPVGALKNIAKTAWLFWKQSDFETALNIVGNRYGGLNGWAIFIGIAGAIAAFTSLKSSRIVKWPFW